MSFVEFLLEYYIYILIVLILLIVTVIGFLVDSNNRKKKTKENVQTENVVGTNDVNNQADATMNGNLNSNTEPLQPQAMISPANNATLNDMLVNANSNVGVNGANVNMNDMVATSINTSSDSSVVNNSAQNVEAVVADGMNNVVNGGQNVNSNVPNMTDNGGQFMNNSMNSNGMMNVMGADMMNSFESVQPVASNVAVNSTLDVSNVAAVNPSVDTASNNNIIDVSQGNVMGLDNSQAVVSNMAVNSIPVQSWQSQVSPNVNEVLVGNVNSNAVNVSSLNPLNQVNYQQSAQPQMSTQFVQPQVNNNINGIPVNNVNQGVVNVSTLGQDNNYLNQQQVIGQVGMIPGVNQVAMPNQGINQNFNTQNQMVSGVSGMASQNGMGMNQVNVPNNTQIGINPNVNVQNTNMAGQQVGNSNVLGNGAVVTSDGSQPFDISSMFVNNQ